MFLTGLRPKSWQSLNRMEQFGWSACRTKRMRCAATPLLQICAGEN